ncbi:MAG: hypothetical protein DIZ78_05025 [endosymbiont of Escarpia spicata]|uniref:HRDC domain-containing protein n=1 Tax=endosymbiont of Escarpia spicata TaxID=2200908 RepID=A0A370DS55_9GAMM|nr:MAG: hypothetical protein DIZ78_05025 [endosymbiont of Escarpia spicata]
MKYQFFTIDARFPEPGQEALNRFCGSMRIVAVEKQFVAAGESSFWSICVTYVQQGEAKRGNKPSVDYREVLNEQDFALYAILRNQRKQLAEAEGIHAYAVFNNEQLAEMVRNRVDSLAALRNIEGIGKAKIDKFGAFFIETLCGAVEKQKPSQ